MRSSKIGRMYLLLVLSLSLVPIETVQSSDLVNGFHIGSVHYIAKQLPNAQSNAYINRIAPQDAAKRLDLENVLPEVTLSNKIATRKNIPTASVLRDLITASSPSDFKTTLGPRLATVEVSTPESVETLPTFQANVTTLFHAQAAKPGYLRVWVGTEVKPPDPYPDTVIIGGNNDICTGTLVTPQHVITAAHCFCGHVTNEVTVGTSLVNAVAHSKVDLDKSHSHIACEKITGDENSVATNIKLGDVALYTLVTPLSGIGTRRISTERSLRAAASVRAVGFGVTNQNVTGVKFTVDIVIASYDCTEAQVAGAHANCAPQAEMVAAGMNRDTCNGDSGGPLYVLGQDVNLYLAAVTSRALKSDCGQGGIYVKLTTPEMQKWLISEGVPLSAFDQ